MYLTSAHLLSLARRRGSHHDFHTYLCNPTEKGDWSSYKAEPGSTEFSVLLGYCCEIAHYRGGFLAFLDNYYFVSDPALAECPPSGLTDDRLTFRLLNPLTFMILYPWSNVTRIGYSKMVKYRNANFQKVCAYKRTCLYFPLPKLHTT